MILSSRFAASRKLGPIESGFSLVEVVIALGIFAFVVVALLGLFSVGIQTNRESIEELEAANLAQTMLNTRRGAPTNVTPSVPPSVLTNFALPPLDTASDMTSQPLYVGSDGLLVANANAARFGLFYRITPDTAAGSSSVYVCLYWPPGASPKNAKGRFEVSTVIALAPAK